MVTKTAELSDLARFTGWTLAKYMGGGFQVPFGRSTIKAVKIEEGALVIDQESGMRSRINGYDEPTNRRMDEKKIIYFGGMSTQFCYALVPPGVPVPGEEVVRGRG